MLISRWDLGDKFGLNDVSLVVDGGEITGFVLPDEPEVCESNQANNLETFDPPLPVPAMPKDLLVLDGSASLHVSGPHLFGSPIEGSTALTTGTLQLATDDSGAPWLAAASWRPAGALELGNEIGSVSIADGRIELRGGARLWGSTARPHRRPRSPDRGRQRDADRGPRRGWCRVRFGLRTGRPRRPRPTMDRRFDREPVALKIRTRRLARALVVLTTASACSDVEPDFVWRGEHLDIHGYGVQERDYCGGTFTHVDAYMGEVSTLFGFDGPRPVLSIGPSEFVDNHCPAGVTGCAVDGHATVVDTALPLDHELVHLAQRSNVDCPPLLAEGLAEYSSWNYWDWGVDPGRIDTVINAWSRGETDYRDYSLLGHFTAYMVEMHGFDRIFVACEQSGMNPSVDQFEQAMAVAFDLPLDQLLAEYQAEYPVCAARDTSRRLVECGQALDATLEAGQMIELDFDLECTNALTLGPRTVQGEPDQVWVNRRLRLEPWLYPHVIRLRASSRATGEPVAAIVSLLPCGRCLDGIEGATIELPEGLSPLPLPSLPAGEYVVEVRQPLADASPLVLTLESPI